MIPLDRMSSSRKLTPAQLAEATRVTLAHYEAVADAFWEGTRDHDVTQNYEAFLEKLPKHRALRILDFGCGPGRDVAYFKSLGHEVTGLDGARAFCRMTEERTGCPTLNQNFLNLDLPEANYDGVFANASLFHVPGQELPRVLRELRRALVPEGILFSSNPRGDGEGWNGPRYGTFLELEPYETLLRDAGFEVLRHYYRREVWLAVVARRVAQP